MVFQGRWVPIELGKTLGWLLLLSILVVAAGVVWLHFFPPRTSREQSQQQPKTLARHPRKKRPNRKSKQLH